MSKNPPVVYFIKITKCVIIIIKTGCDTEEMRIDLGKRNKGYLID